MKKLNLLIGFLSIIFILSCSSDDGVTMQDEIVGIWKPINYVEIYTGAGEVEFESSDCEQQTRLTFNSDGSYEEQNFQEDNDNNCVEYNTNFISGIWEKIAQNQYAIQYTLFNEETQQNEVYQGDQDEIIFINENIMRIIFDQNEEQQNGDILEYYYSEFQRVE